MDQANVHLSLLLITLAQANVLELGTCNYTGGQLLVEESFKLSSDMLSDSNKSAARSFIECILQCIQEGSACRSTFRTDGGECYQLNSICPSEARSTTAVEGTFARPPYDCVSRYEGDGCDGVACPDDSSCMSGCSGQRFDTTTCLATERDCLTISSYSNVRHYWAQTHNQDDTGVAIVVSYPKLRSSTGIRVILNMDVKTRSRNSDKCHSWHLTFDGNRCTNPGDIQHVEYGEGVVLSIRPLSIDGICYGIGEKDVEIKLVLDVCAGFSTANPGTGNYMQSKSLIIMEVEKQQDSWEGQTPCPSLSTFNLKYQVWHEDKNLLIDTSTEQLLKEVDYVKLASDSLLRIKYYAVIGISASANEMKCGQWRIKVDGEHCGPVNATADIMVNHPTSKEPWIMAASSSTLEAICDNHFEPGGHKIQIYLGQCRLAYTQPTNFIVGAGLNASSSLQIEEVRLKRPVDAMMGMDNKVCKSVASHILHKALWALNFETDVADVIYTFQYVKQFADTTLRLTASGGHGLICDGTQEICAMWYFEIDGNECSSPGTIAGTIAFDEESEYYAPMQVGGVCYDITSGAHDISYLVKKCQSDGIIGTAKVSYESPFFFYAEELRLQEMKRCTDADPVDCTK